MHRRKQIIYTAHCVLNQNAVIREWERAQGAFNDIISVLLEEHISIIQLPCPEFTFLGENRPPKTKEEYDIPDYRKLCRQLAKQVVNQMKEYIGNNYQILGLVGIQGSPSCDTLTKKGIFMEELVQLMRVQNIHLEFFDIPEEYIEGRSEKMVDDFRNYIAKKF
ncbi:Predicted secreted protein [Anaerovirgula multivorans]|uniref:Predicted secreted protein n=1 Tax=Anaerovirgula multivorans TaxID=312168 RepID=A0A239KX03_9FIRM|nr:CD3072 family TudS-related putative desulfidase [Anaerovirgula multivorans]SNT22168.1 Predicted secreted protein [Anaerovirgula multivorans]